MMDTYVGLSFFRHNHANRLFHRGRCPGEGWQHCCCLPWTSKQVKGLMNLHYIILRRLQCYSLIPSQATSSAVMLFTLACRQLRFSQRLFSSRSQTYIYRWPCESSLDVCKYCISISSSTNLIISLQSAFKWRLCRCVCSLYRRLHSSQALQVFPSLQLWLERTKHLSFFATKLNINYMKVIAAVVSLPWHAYSEPFASLPLIKLWCVQMLLSDSGLSRYGLPANREWGRTGELWLRLNELPRMRVSF